MPDTLETHHDIALWMCADDGPRVREVRDALDLIGDAGFNGAEWVVVPVSRLDEDFFRLRTGVAGEIMQKFANYRLRLAVVGDITAYTAASGPLTDLVRECNRGRHVWFVPDLDTLTTRLADGATA
ncbi:DUF4180 domain-containing protein [Embleya sp. NBC_00896]|uniref:DUF4180 domain-containing protein n=1 Tax=Embleya sp. NBC_00896 TaxID=2975961 RepID=UPI0038636F68|nr:DUF4180 domain-containing protein [Embleya sp. NBC_00896]